MTDQPKKELSKEEAEARDKDLQARVKGFNEDFIPLLKKWELGLGASAFLLPDGRIAARPQMFDDKKYDEGAPVEAPVAPAPSGELAKSE